MMDYDRDDEGAPDIRVLRHVTRTAAKHHACDSCCGAINPGQQYNLYVGLLDGEFEVMRSHTAPCWDSAAREGAGVRG